MCFGIGQCCRTPQELSCTNASSGVVLSDQFGEERLAVHERGQHRLDFRSTL